MSNNDISGKSNVHGGDIYGYDCKEMIDFSANINPLGMPQSVKKAIVDNIDSYANYPDPFSRQLTTAISKHENIGEDCIVCGNGAADIIFRTVLYCKPKKAILLAPTFSEYEQALKLCDCEIIYHYLDQSNGFNIKTDIFEKITSDIDMVFICNPNNPTGIPTDSSLIMDIARKCKSENAIVVVDECFNDFLENPLRYSVVGELADIRNTIVLKAFTKIYAMAGIRLGYALCSDSTLINGINNTLQPWSVSTVASKCGVAALGEIEFVDKTRLLITKNRQYLISELKKLGLVVFPSQANYVFFRCEYPSITEKLRMENILIRSCENYVGLKKGYYRIAVKNHDENMQLINCLQKILEE